MTPFEKDEIDFMRIPDQNDFASALEDRERESLISSIRNASAKRPEYTGQCYYCEEAIESPLIFCDANCRDDFEREQAALRRNGQIR